MNLTMFSFMVVGIPKPKIKMDNMKGFSPAQAEEKHIYDERFFPRPKPKKIMKGNYFWRHVCLTFPLESISCGNLAKDN